MPHQRGRIAAVLIRTTDTDGDKATVAGEYMLYLRWTVVGGSIQLNRLAVAGFDRVLGGIAIEVQGDSNLIILAAALIQRPVGQRQNIHRLLLLGLIAQVIFRSSGQKVLSGCQPLLWQIVLNRHDLRYSAV